MRDAESILSLLDRLGAIEIGSWPVRAMGKPRMTQRDRWNPSPQVKRYLAFKDELRLRTASRRSHIEEVLFSPGSTTAWIFYVKMPTSYYRGGKRSSENTKAFKLRNTGMDQKPDLDNIMKAVWDTLAIEDKAIYGLMAWKLWSDEDRITMYHVPHSLHG